MIQIYIKKDPNIVKYISAIRKYDKMLSIGDIRDSIQNGTPVLTKDLIEYDFYDEFVNGTDEYTKNLMFLSLIKSLTDMGANIVIKNVEEVDEVIDLKSLEAKIRFVKQIAEDTEKYPD